MERDNLVRGLGIADYVTEMLQAARITVKVTVSLFILSFYFLFKTLKLLQTMNIYITTIRNNLRVTKTKMCVARYTNKIWAQKCF